MRGVFSEFYGLTWASEQILKGCFGPSSSQFDISSFLVLRVMRKEVLDQSKICLLQ